MATDAQVVAFGDLAGMNCLQSTGRQSLGMVVGLGGCYFCEGYWL